MSDTHTNGVAADTVKHITLAQAAEIAGCSSETVRRAVQSGDLTGIRPPYERRILVDEADVRAWADRKRRPAPVMATDATVRAWAKRVAASAPPMTSEQAQYVMSALHTASPALAAAQGGAAA